MCGRRVLVERGGRRFIVHPPTVATVMLATTLFEQEITGYLEAAKVDPELREPVGIGTALARILPACLDERIGEVLETCVDVVGGVDGDVRKLASVDAELAAMLAAGVIGRSNLARGVGVETIESVLGSLGTPGEVVPDEGVNAFELVVCQLAAQYSCGPHDVMRWPWDVFELASEAAPLLRPSAAGTAASEPAPREVDVSQIADLGIGIGVHKV